MLVRNLLFTLTIICLVSICSAQSEMNANSENLKIRKNVSRPEGKGWFIYGTAGYGIPFLSTNKFSFKEIGNKDWFQTPSSLSVKPIYGTLGGGWQGSLGWGHMFNKFIGIDILHTIALHPNQLSARINTDIDLGGGRKASYYAEEFTKIMPAIYINQHLVMHWDNNKRFGITGKAGLCMPIGGSPVTKAKIIDESGRLLQTLAGLPVIPITALTNFRSEYTATAKSKLKPTIGVSASMAFDVRLFKNVWAFAEVRVQAFTISPSETIFTEFSLKTETDPLLLGLIGAIAPIPLNIANVDEAPEFLKRFVYKKEITEESNTLRYSTGLTLKEIDINKPMEEPGIKYNASTLYFNVGVRMNFTQNWDKRRAAKVQPRRDAKAAKKENN
ncbi:MAG TPA: hypothetical protein PKV76_03915 [Chitinophagales bacterium]|nr:hypothetical protein [Chitinophagales bacterium]